MLLNWQMMGLVILQLIFQDQKYKKGNFKQEVFHIQTNYIQCIALSFPDVLIYVYCSG